MKFERIHTDGLAFSELPDDKKPITHERVVALADDLRDVAHAYNALVHRRTVDIDEAATCFALGRLAYEVHDKLQELRFAITDAQRGTLDHHSRNA